MNRDRKAAANKGPPNKRTYVNSETGRKVNDYIPKFISSTPWYYENEALKVDSQSRKRKSDDEMYRLIADKSVDRLKHQRLDPEGKVVPYNEAKSGSDIVDEFVAICDDDGEDQVDRCSDGIANDKTDDNDNNDNKNKSRKEDTSSLRRKVREWKKKGRCGNCGGKHQKSECFEKPHSISYIYRNDGDNNRQGKRGVTYVKKEAKDWDEVKDRWRGVDINEEYGEIVDNLKKKEERLLSKFVEDNQDADRNDKDTIVKAIMKDNPLALDPNDKIITRSLEDKPRYLEVIKTGEELRYNPKSRVYKDLKEGYLNERGQFVRYLTGEAAEFEKLKKFAKSVQSEQQKKWRQDSENTEKVVNPEYATEISPTAAMLKMKEKEEKDKLVKEAKKKALLEKYGAL